MADSSLTLSALLRELRKLDMPIKVENGILYVQKKELSQELLKEIEVYRSELIDYLKNKEHEIKIFSKVLNKEVIVNWSDNNAQVVYVDFTRYTRDELNTLKQRKKASIAFIHGIKEQFTGQIEGKK
jgi:hypothetical protein